MPCRCDDYPREETTCQTCKKWQKAADIATRAACDMRTILRRHNLLEELTTETLKWVKKHDEQDAIRIAKVQATGEREATKRRALNKLTLEERRVLGL